MSGRGCFNRCTFCNSTTIRQHYRDEGFNFLRRRSVNDVIEELSLAKKSYAPTFVYFCDDTFIYNKKYMNEFAGRYAEEVGIPFGCSSIPNFFDEEIIDKLVLAGLSNVEVGIQTLNAETRMNIFGRRESNDDFRRFVRMLRHRGVYVNTDHIINPWDSRESLKEQIKIYSEIRPSYINVFYLQYFPDTKVIDSALKQGLLTPDAVDAVGEGLLDSYFSGGSVGDDVSSFDDLSLFLSFTPFLPSAFVKWLLDSRMIVLLRYIPKAVALPLRAISAGMRKADFVGRSHLKALFYSFIKHLPKADPRRVADIKAVAWRKTGQSLRPAVPLRVKKT
jgi:hypothetical protein